MELATLIVYVSTLILAANIDSAAARVRLVPIDSPDETIVDGQKQPLVKFALLYTDECGATHIKYCRFEGLSFRSFAPPAEPQWVGPLSYEPTNLTLAILPVGYVGTWHTAPGPQLVAVLSGAWSLEATDRTVLHQKVGDWHYDGDTDSRPRPNDSRVGHLTRQVGDKPCVQLVISLKKHPKVICD